MSHFRFPTSLASGLLGFVWLLTSPAIATETRVTVERVDLWTNLFSSGPFVLRFKLQSDQRFEGRLLWRLAATGRTLQRGELPLRLAAGADKEANVVSISVAAPQIKPGTTLPIQLTLRVADDQGIAAKLAVDLLVFPRNPFGNRRSETRRQRLVLFDPVGDTNQALSQLKIPFRKLHNLEATADLPDCLFVIGEGVNWNRHRGLSKLVWDLAADKTDVLALAPAEASLPFGDGQTNRLPRPQRICFGGPMVIRSLDKPLDSQGWLGNGDLIRQTFRLVPIGGKLKIQTQGAEGSWSWFEADYGTDAGSLILCGFGIFENWDASPTPRYLFLRILEQMAGDRSGQATDSDID